MDVVGVWDRGIVCDVVRLSGSNVGRFVRIWMVGIWVVSGFGGRLVRSDWE